MRKYAVVLIIEKKYMQMISYQNVFPFLWQAALYDKDNKFTNTLR